MASWNSKYKVGWSRAIRSWRLDRALHLSVPFTWLADEAEKIARAHDGPVIAGGPGLQLLYPDGCEWADIRKETRFDTLSIHNPLATRTTRGCPNRCAFCAVPRLEGEFRELPFLDPPLRPILCDDNFLAASEGHIARIIEALRRRAFPEVDFNQGLDARLFNEWHAAQFASLHQVGTKPILRFSFDAGSMEEQVERAVERARSAGFPKRRIRIYVLIGFKDFPADAHYRCQRVREWGLKPNPMRYQPLDARRRNEYVGPCWTAGLLRRVCRYYARNVFQRIPFEEFEVKEPHHANPPRKP